MPELILVDIMDAGPELDGYVRCRCCGCWEYDPCYHELYGECFWIEADLCSRCEGAHHAHS